MLDEVTRILNENAGLADVGQPQSPSDVMLAEQGLNVKFPEALSVYLSRWGWISFGPNEYYGLGTDINDIVKRTMELRQRSGLPEEYVAICNHDGDEYVCLNTQDCSVAVWDVPTRKVSRIRAGSFEEFLASDMRDFL